MTSAVERPFDNFRHAITDPEHFFGRGNILREILHQPLGVRILLGGRRLGKTSLLHALEWSMLNCDSHRLRRTFPVLVNLQREQPRDMEYLLHVMVNRLCEATSSCRELLGKTLMGKPSSELDSGIIRRETSDLRCKACLTRYEFRRAIINSCDDLQEWNFEGVCFLIDEAEFVVRQADLANSAWGYFRSLCDDDVAVAPRLGLILTGYRNLNEYQQQVGSPLLNIAHKRWLTTFTLDEAKELIVRRADGERIELTVNDINLIIKLTGGHPFLTQQLLNYTFDIYHSDVDHIIHESAQRLRQEWEHVFSDWWGAFDEADRIVYHALVGCSEATIKDIKGLTHLSLGKVRKALQMLTGTGVIHRLDPERYSIGTLLFRKWVMEDEQ